MHSRHTVKYICEVYPSGRKLYYKTELVTMGSWSNPESLYWTRPRPITEQTLEKNKKAGFPVEIRHIKEPSAQVIVFDSLKKDAEGRARHVRHKKTGRKDGGRTARIRWP